MTVGLSGTPDFLLFFLLIFSFKATTCSFFTMTLQKLAASYHDVTAVARHVDEASKRSTPRQPATIKSGDTSLPHSLFAHFILLFLAVVSMTTQHTYDILTANNISPKMSHKEKPIIGRHLI